MKTLIIEDEKAALRNLKAVIEEIAAPVEIIGEVDSIVESIAWFQQHPMPELVFMDIHLADGSAFEIFNHVEIKCPIIFTTAYDEYALRAFNVNGIAYLLKPITRADLQSALDKLKVLGRFSERESHSDLLEVIRNLKQEVNYKTHFLIPVKGDRFIPVSVDTILFFYIADSIVKAVDTDLKEFVFTQSLDELAEVLDPALFFRANRQFLISRKSIVDVRLWFNGRLVINLKAPVADKVVVSKAKVPEFKEWF